MQITPNDGLVDEPTWKCCRCKSDNVWQEGACLYNMNDGQPSKHEGITFKDFYWCDDCGDECEVEQHPAETVLELTTEGCTKPEDKTDYWDMVNSTSG